MVDQNTQLLGQAPAWLSAQEHVSRVAPLDRSILVIGERGTGKELIGERLHFLSKRWDGPFVKVNCAALSETLLDSELFGHERGAFTGATEMRRGRFELADGGTIFPDEIATASAGSGKIAACCRVWRIPAGGRFKSTLNGCSHSGRHKRRPAGHGGGRRIPRRSSGPTCF